MKARASAVELIKEQMERYKKPDGNKHHYGRQELRELMDFIYESKPVSDDEKI